MAARKHRSALSIRRRAASRRASRAARHAAAATRATLRRLRRPTLVVAGMVVLATIMGAGAFTASGFYRDYGAPRTPVSVLSWQLRAASYSASDCRGCHDKAASASAGQPHARLLCETCHLPSVAHPGPVTGVVQMLPAATSADCTACHAAVATRPLDFSQVALESHYPGADCLRCHDSHTTAAVRPPEVTHPLTNLPPCATCHAPLGLKSYPANHEPAPDTVCVACHRLRVGGR